MSDPTDPPTPAAEPGDGPGDTAGLPVDVAAMLAQLRGTIGTLDAVLAAVHATSEARK